VRHDNLLWGLKTAQFGLSHCPRPCWGSLQCSPDPLARCPAPMPHSVVDRWGLLLGLINLAVASRPTVQMWQFHSDVWNATRRCKTMTAADLKQFEGGKKFSSSIWTTTNVKPLELWRKVWLVVLLRTCFDDRSGQRATYELGLALTLPQCVVQFPTPFIACCN